MNPKERILAAIQHKPVDRIPMDYWGTTECNEKLLKEFQLPTMEALFEKLELDKIYDVSPTYIGPPLQNHPHESIDIWGVKTAPIYYNDGKGVYHEISHHPIQHCATIDEIKACYTFPKADWFDFSTIETYCETHANHAIKGGYIAPFYCYNNIRGLEQSLIDLISHPELAGYIIEEICTFYYEYHERLFEAGNGRIDLAEVTDDFGTQHGLMISLDMFNRYFKEPYKRFIQLVKDHSIHVFHHDDGAIADLIPTLVELGIEVLNPIQWHLPGMDLIPLKENFGKDICFHGAIDNQHVLPFGSTQEVEQEVALCIDTLASDKTGYILAPCHNLQVITPVENVLTMYQTAKEYRFG